MLLRRALIVCACLAVICGPSSAAKHYRAVKTTGFSLGLVSDWHGGGYGIGLAGARIFEWFSEQSPKPLAVLHAGDIGIERFRIVRAQAAESGMQFLTTLGNWDYDKDYNSVGELYPEGASPIDTAMAAIGEMRRGRTPYYVKDFGPVRVLFVAANGDTTVLTGGILWEPCYYPANPPGRGLDYWQSEGFELGNPNWTNPEYASWSSADTTYGQQAWVKARCAEHDGTFIIAVGHRSPYAPFEYDSYDDLVRPPDRAARSHGWAVASRAGVDLALTGDTHRGSLSKRMYRGVQSSTGTYFVTSRVTNLWRSSGFGYGQDSPSLSEDDMYWPKVATIGDADEPSSTLFGYIEFFGDVARVKLMQGHPDGSFSERASVVIRKRRVS